MERGESLETMAERVKREGERKSDSLTAVPNGFSGEREGVQGRQRHNEWAMTRAQRDGGRDKERWRLYSRWVNMERERAGGEGETLNEQQQE